MELVSGVVQLRPEDAMVEAMLLGGERLADAHPGKRDTYRCSDLAQALTQDFYSRFYHVTPTPAQIDHVLAGRD